jgi:hypothetical protein
MRDMHPALEAHLGSHQVSRVVYGSIIGLAVVLVLEVHPTGAGSVVASLVATAIAVGLAELYSELVGEETRLRRRVPLRDIVHVLDDVAAVAFGIAFPAVFFVLAAAGLFELDTAFALARWSGLGLIGAYGFLAARLSGAGLVSSLAHGLVIGTVAAALIVVKALVH